MKKPLLCRLGIHRPFTMITELWGSIITYNECDRCPYHWEWIE